MMISGIKGSRKVKHYQKGSMVIIMSKINVVLYLEKGSLITVTNFVCRVEYFMELVIIHVLLDLHCRCLFDNLACEIYIGNRPVIWKFIPVKIDLFDDRSNHSLFQNMLPISKGESFWQK